MNILKKTLLMVLVILAFTSCKKDEEKVDNDGTVITTGHAGGATCSPKYVATSAEGKLDKNIFKVVSVTASDDYFDNTKFRITFNDVALVSGKCYVANSTVQRTITVGVKKEVGVYNLSSDNSVTFSTIKTGSTVLDVIQCGQIEIMSISATEITGRIHAKGDENNLNGTFVAKYCK